MAFSNSVASLEDMALDLLNRLSIERKSDNVAKDGRPIIFVCHNLGGIIVKRALLLAHERSSDSGFQYILISTKGISRSLIYRIWWCPVGRVCIEDC